MYSNLLQAAIWPTKYCKWPNVYISSFFYFFFLIYFALYLLSYTWNQTSCSSQALFSKNITIDLLSHSMKKKKKYVKDFKEIHLLSHIRSHIRSVVPPQQNRLKKHDTNMRNMRKRLCINFSLTRWTNWWISRKNKEKENSTIYNMSCLEF